MKTLLVKFCLLLSTFLSVAAFASSEIREYNQLSQVRDLSEKLAAQTKPEEIWLVYDIDNTLLSGLHPIATSEWFDWQASLIKGKISSPLRTADSIDQLVTQQVHIFDWVAMKPVEKETISIVEALQYQGHPTMVLTARTPDTFTATFRELAKNNLFFTESSRPLKPQTHYPHALTHGYSVIFDAGIMMVSGQNKGLLLQQLFDDQGITAKYIIFVDDSATNVHHMAEAFKNDNKHHVIAVHYTHTEPKVQQFKQSNKETWVHDYFEFQALWEKLQG